MAESIELETKTYTTNTKSFAVTVVNNNSRQYEGQNFVTPMYKSLTNNL